MLEQDTVVRRQLDFEDYMGILRRNVGWIIGPIFAGLVVTTVVAFLLQDTYISTALIRIVPQQISDEIIQKATAEDMTDRINGMAQSIVSRTTLTNLINTYGLYKSELKSEPMEDVVNKMHTDIAIRPRLGIANVQGKGLPAMEVSFKYRDRMMANKICQELVSRFMNLSTSDTMDSQTQANDFLSGERDKAKAELDRLDKRLSDYRAKHAGTLPEEMQGNFQQMSAAEQRLQALNDAATRNNERRMMLESSLRIAKDRLAAIPALSAASAAHTERNVDLDKQISDLEANIASMKDRYTADYPDLQVAQERLTVLKHQRDSLAKTQKPNDTDNPAMSRERLDVQGQIDSIQAQMKALNVENQEISKELLSAEGQLRSFQGRLAQSPAGEGEYGDLVQSRDMARLKFLELDGKTHKSQMSMDLEKDKQGETLELIDSPSLPTEPTEPKRYLIIPLGAACGLIAGLIVIAIREVRDTSLRSLKDARAYTQLSILGSIPLLENDVVVQRRKQVSMVSWATAILLGVAIAAGSVAHYYMNRA